MDIVPVSEFPAAAALTGAELVPVVQGGITSRTTIGALSAAAALSQIQNLRSTGRYRGSVQAIDSVGFPSITVDTTGSGASVADGTLVPSGTKGQAIPRITGTSGAADSAGVGFFNTAINTFYRAVSGTGATTRGFTLDSLVMIEAITNGQCVFFGMAQTANSSVVNTVTQPSSLSQMVGFAKDSGDTYLQFMLRAAGSVTKVPLTGVSVASLVNHLLAVHIAATPTGVDYRLTDLETGAVIANGSASTNMPAADQAMRTHMAVFAAPSGASDAVALSFYNLAVEITP